MTRIAFKNRSMEFEGSGYVMDNAQTVSLGSIGTKATPFGSVGKLEVKSNVPVPKLEGKVRLLGPWEWANSVAARRWVWGALVLTGSMLVGACNGSDEPEPPPPGTDLVVREFVFSRYLGRSMRLTELMRLTPEGPEEVIVDLGPAPIDQEVFSSIGGGVRASDGIANGQLFSTEGGITYGALAEAPLGNPNVADSPAGSRSFMNQKRSFIKRSGDAKLDFTLTGAFIDLRDDGPGFTNSSSNPKCVYPPNLVGSLDACQDIVRGRLDYFVRAYIDNGGTPGSQDVFFARGAVAEIHGHNGQFSPYFGPTLTMGQPLWTADDFKNEVLDNLRGVIYFLDGSRKYVIDLSSVPIGARFTVSSTVLAEATNRQGNIFTGVREAPSAAAAYLRDPLGTGGSTIAFSGLEPVAHSGAPEPAAALLRPAACATVPAPDPQAGTIQFSAAAYTIEELGGATQPVRITREGGSRGAITATFSTSDGTAVAGTDYTPVAATVFFADGDTAPRMAEVPIVRNTLVGEPSRAVLLSLTEPGGCASLGAQRTAVLTIVDAELPVTPTFTIGGTVTGLLGNGLVLTNSFTGDLSITASGTFTFAQALGDRLPYDVRVKTQPSSPVQLCVVTRGSGTVAGANVTDVVVDCAAASAASGLDTSFGAGGKATTPSTGVARAVALQSDGRIVTVGGAFTLTRHRADGSLDSSFGSGGKVTTSFGSGAGSANDVAIQPDGRIVVVGSSRASAGSSSGDNFTLRRYLPNGSLDASFGSGGGVDTDFAAGADIAKAVAIQPDGKIVVAGQARIGSANDFAVARYHADGTLDTSFGSGGKVTTDIAGASDGLPALVLQPDGKIMLAGRFGSGSSVGGAAVVRYLANGSLDSAFGSGGKVTVTGSVEAEAIALQADGAILVAGTATGGTGGPAFGVMRLLADGRVDPAFGTATTRFFSAGNGSFARNLAVKSDGKIVLVGEAASGASGTFDMAVARIEPNGALDTAFGEGGHLVVDFFGDFDGAVDLAIQPDGKIVVAGSADNGLPNEFALIRVQP